MAVTVQLRNGPARTWPAVSGPLGGRASGWKVTSRSVASISEATAPAGRPRSDRQARGSSGAERVGEHRVGLAVRAGRPTWSSSGPSHPTGTENPAKETGPASMRLRSGASPSASVVPTKRPTSEGPTGARR